MRAKLLALCVSVLLLLAGLWAGTQWAAGRFGHGAFLGPRLELAGGPRVYPPWALLGWHARWGRLPAARPALAGGLGVALAGVLLALVPPLLASRHARLRVREVGAAKWAAERHYRAAGLLTGRGTVVGELPPDRSLVRWLAGRAAGGRLLTFDGPEHQLVAGASRSGKGVGHVIPTLLSWPGSCLAYDVKGELWEETAGFRSKFGRCVLFDPTDPRTARINPLLEVRKGEREVADAQNVALMLVNPDGSKGRLDVWDESAAQLLVAVILHVLYAEPDGAKHLGTVRDRVLRLRKTLVAMVETPHVLYPATGEARPHKEVELVAREALAQPPKFLASVRATALQYLTLWADPVAVRATSASDLTLSDLMCAGRPLTLYLRPPPSDAVRLRPLTRLLLNLACQRLMVADRRADGRGRPKRHRLLLMLDEFPTLGRLEFFQANLRQMAGYGVKAHLVVQSFNDVAEAYGPTNSIIDNCHVLAAFASADTSTQQRVSQMTGTVTEYRESYSGPRARLPVGLGGRQMVSHAEQVRPLLQPGDVRELPGDEQLLFVTGFPPMRTRKVRYFEHPVLRRRVLPPPDPHAPPAPGEVPPDDWAGERAKGPRAPSGIPESDDPGAEDGGGPEGGRDEAAGPSAVTPPTGTQGSLFDRPGAGPGDASVPKPVTPPRPAAPRRKDLI